MKKAAFLIALVAALGCGPSTQAPAPSPAPPAPPTGPGTATASDGVPIAYTVAGSGSPALVFIHGWMCDQTYWAAQVDAFAPRCTVVTLDLGGHGRSGMNRPGWPLKAFGGDVAAVVNKLGLDKVILVGHSMGGPVALEAARLMPEKVIGVVGVDTLQDADQKWDPKQMRPFLDAMEKDFPGTCRGFVASMFPKDAEPALLEKVAGGMCSGPPEVGVALMRQFIDYDLAAALTAVPPEIPIRCINSTAHPTNVEGNRVYHADFDVVTMDGVGHFLFMEKPQEFNTDLEAVIQELSSGRPANPAPPEGTATTTT